MSIMGIRDFPTWGLLGSVPLDGPSASLFMGSRDFSFLKSVGTTRLSHSFPKKCDFPYPGLTYPTDVGVCFRCLFFDCSRRRRGSSSGPCSPKMGGGGEDAELGGKANGNGGLSGKHTGPSGNSSENAACGGGGSSLTACIPRKRRCTAHRTGDL